MSIKEKKINKRGYCYEPWSDSAICGADAYTMAPHVFLSTYGITNSYKGGPTYLGTCGGYPILFCRIYNPIKYISV